MPRGVPRILAATLLALAMAGPSISAENTRIDAVTAAEIGEIRATFRNVGLHQANVELAKDGRITLVGEYENRDEVETAFSAARSVVGLRRVAPTTPSNIKYRLKNFDLAFSSAIGRMMKKPASLKPAAGAVPASPPVQQSEASPAPAAPPPAELALSPARQADTAPARQRPPQSYGLIIGVGKFKNLPESNYLEGADKDARDVYRMLTAADGGKLPKENVQLLTQEQATSGAVKAAMQEMLNKTQAGDTVVLFAASHGLPNAMNKFDVVLHDTEFPRKKAGGKDSFDFATTNRATALTDDEFQNFIAQLTLKDVRTVVVLDTCYSGKTFSAVPGFLPTRTRSLALRQKEVAYTTAMSQDAMNELAQQAKDLKTTRIVIVSASEDEESMEAPNLGGGAFTQTYLSQLHKIHDYADAFDKAKPSVIRIARTVGHSQTPRMLVIPEEAVTKM